MKMDFVECILNKYRGDELSHVYLIETNNIDCTYNKVLTLIKQLQCPNEYSNDCNKCNVCALIDSFNNPNVITLEPDGINIKKEQIADLQKRFLTKPLISKYNIYIIKGAEFLNESSENALLKFLEEPEEFILGFLITENEDKLLSTITSRCQKYNDFYEINKEISNELINIANRYYDIMFSNPLRLLLVNKDTAQVINNRELLSVFFEYLLKKYISDNKILNNKIIMLLKSLLNDIKYNVNIELMLDKFVLEMSDIND